MTSVASLRLVQQLEQAKVPHRKEILKINMADGNRARSEVKVYNVPIELGNRKITMDFISLTMTKHREAPLQGLTLNRKPYAGTGANFGDQSNQGFVHDQPATAEASVAHQLREEGAHLHTSRRKRSE